MKKLTFALPALALLLASCGDPTPQVDPLTLSFTTTGSADWGPSAPVTLMHTFLTGGTAQAIGTLNPDKTVRITVTPNQVATAKPIAISNFKNVYSDCTVTGLAGTDGVNYYRINYVDFKIGNTESYLRPGSSVKNADGTYSWTHYQFWYMNKDATLTGTAVCPSSTVSISLNLKAGWNQVQRTYTYNPTTKLTTNDQLVVMNQSNTYSGGWLVYTRQN